MTEVNIDRTARLMIQYYDRYALIKAAMHQVKLATEGDVEGAGEWAQICESIEWLQTQQTGSPAH